jgi:hypothetical protein
MRVAETDGFVPLRERAERRPALSHSRIAALSCLSAAFTRLHKRAGLPDRIKSRRQALGVHRHDSADADADRRERIWAAGEVSRRQLWRMLSVERMRQVVDGKQASGDEAAGLLLPVDREGPVWEPAKMKAKARPPAQRASPRGRLCKSEREAGEVRRTAAFTARARRETDPC